MSGQHPGRDRLAARLHEACHLTGSFTLRSGATSEEYFDKYLFEAEPALLREVAAAMVERIPEGVAALAGLQLGGVPLATAMSLQTGLPARFVRKEPKPYGTERLAEGGDIEGLALLVVEDVVTTGGQLAESCRRLRERGAQVVAAMCVIDRGAIGDRDRSAIGDRDRSAIGDRDREGDARERLADMDVELISLFTAEELAAAAR